MSQLLGSVALAALIAAPAWVQAQGWNVELLSQQSLHGGGGRLSFQDVWGYTAPDGTELAIIGT